MSAYVDDDELKPIRITVNIVTDEVVFTERGAISKTAYTQPVTNRIETI